MTLNAHICDHCSEPTWAAAGSELRRDRLCFTCWATRQARLNLVRKVLTPVS